MWSSWLPETFSTVALAFYSQIMYVLVLQHSLSQPRCSYIEDFKISSVSLSGISLLLGCILSVCAGCFSLLLNNNASKCICIIIRCCTNLLFQSILNARHLLVLKSFSFIAFLIFTSVVSLICFSPGEIVVNEVNFVRKCINAEGSQDDLWGKLICTNFKVSFIPQDAPLKQVYVWTEVLKQSLGFHYYFKQLGA